MQPKTIALLTSAKARRLRHPKTCHFGESKEGKRYQLQLTRQRKALAEKLRQIRQTEGHKLARVYARAS